MHEFNNGKTESKLALSYLITTSHFELYFWLPIFRPVAIREVIYCLQTNYYLGIDSDS